MALLIVQFMHICLLNMASKVYLEQGLATFSPGNNTYSLVGRGDKVSISWMITRGLVCASEERISVPLEA